MQNKTLEGFRLSPQQEHLWSLYESDYSQAYCTVGVVHLAGRLDVELLRTALQEVVARNEILRTTFYRLPEMNLPVQVIATDSTVDLDVIDLSKLGKGEQDVYAETVFEEARRLPFNLDHGPLLRATLLPLEAERHLLTLSLPALCSDSAGLVNLVKEIGRVYEAMRSGAPVGANLLQYADAAEWLHELLETQRESDRVLFAGTPESDASPVPALPSEHSPREDETYTCATIRVALDAGLVGRIEAQSERLEVTPANFLLACWQLLLWRLTGQVDVTIGIELEGRGHPQLKNALGLFAQYVRLRSRLRASMRLDELVAGVAGAALDSIGGQEKFIRSLHGAADMSGTAPRFVPYAFAVREQPPEWEVGGLRLSVREQYACIDRFAVRVCALWEGKYLSVQFDYDASHFDREDITRLTEGFKQLLGNAAESPEAVIGELDIVGPAERQAVLYEFNDTRKDFAVDARLHKLFEAQVERTPDATALVFEGEQLSYNTLNERANRIAHYLRKRGVGPEVTVGLCAERSLELVAGLLGVLKAGGAYLPLDPGYPKERIGFIVSDARPALLLTQTQLADALHEHEVPLVFLDEQEHLAVESAANPEAGATTANLAYVIYTSGSTGRPKGVMIPHGAIGNRLLWMQSLYPLKAEDRLLQKTSVSFDASVWELFVPLLSGATLVLSRPGGHQDSAYMVQAVRERKITVLQLVPSMLRVFLSELGVEKCTSLRRVFCGGEALSAALVDQFYSLFKAELCNLYGPTEVSIDATSYPCRPGHAEGIVPIGKPLANVQVHLLNEYLRPVPIGAPGEIYVGGAGLARGYFERPDLTAEKFVPDPFAGAPGSLLYRTGDLGRRQSDGTIEFLGRVDHQVKVRGFRIELGEIESVLRQHPGVRDAVALAREDEPGNQRLVAYVVAQNEETNGHGSPGSTLREPKSQARLSTSDLHNYLTGKLPSYMVPSWVVQLDDLPKLPNGKVDRQALPRPHSVPDLERGVVAPRTPIEEVLAVIWSEVLDIADIGINENFFQLGGHSLLMMQVIARVREAIQVELPLRAIFEAPTISELAGRVDELLRAGISRKMPSLRRTERDGELPMSFAQQRLWFLQQLNPQSTAYNIAHAFRLSGALAVEVLERTLGEILRRHESLRTTFAVHDGQPVQIVQPAADVSVRVVDLRDLPLAECEKRAEQLSAEEGRPFDLERGPLWRTLLLQLGDEEFLALFTMHHIVSDGWSIGVLVHEFVILYEAFLQGLPSPLPELPIQYADFAHWQREWLRDDVLEAQLAYWRNHLAESVTLDLPTDRARPAVQTTHGAQQFFTIAGPLAVAIKALARSEGVTLFMTLLAAFKTLLYFYSRQTDIRVGVPIAGRQHVETEGLIGFFVNTLVLRTDLSGEPTFRELLRRVREVTLGAFVHQDVPFEILVEKLQPERSLSRTPLFQVAFSLQNNVEEVLALPGLSLNPVVESVVTAKFDMTFNLMERAGDFVGALEYNTDLFEHQTIAVLLEQFNVLLERVTADPDCQLSELSLLRAAKRRELLYERNETRAGYPRELCIHKLFEAQAMRTPASTAVIDDEEELTYGELNERAERLSAHLRSCGIGVGARVGIFLNHSRATIIAILGVLKSGAAYVPLDPEHPQVRLSYIIEDAALAVVLTEQELTAKLPVSGARVWLLDEGLWPGVVQGGEPGHAVPDSDAYIIYTSGSTGQPKGVRVRHSSLVNYIWWAKDIYLRDDPFDFALYSSLAFDLTVTSIFTPLITGNRIIVYRKGLPELALQEVLEDDRVDVLKLTPSHLSLVAESDNRRRHVRRLIVGGEALTTELARRVYESFGGGIEIFNEYGPTEATVGCMIYRFDPERDQRMFVPVGLPAANAQIYVLDSEQRPLAENMPGELYIGGAGLAAGYLNQPGLTAEKFIDNPFRPGEKMYRSGDVARWLPEGVLEFLGRADEQVKFHGYRVEPGEIRSALNSHPQIRDSVVVLARNQSSQDLLVAYYVSRQEIEAAELRDFLASRIIKATIPSIFIRLPKLPLTLNGKVNYGALPTLEQAREMKGQSYVAPATRVERILADIWAEVLGVERVGVNHNFFDLGGHSLLIVRVNSRLREALDRDVSLVNMFEYPTVKALARFLTRAEGEPSPAAPGEQSDTRKESLRRRPQLREKRRASRGVGGQYD